MAFTDSRLGPGTLTIGATPLDVSTQVSALVLTPSADETDGTPTLALPDPAPELKTSFTLDGTAIGDWESATGLQRYAFEHDGEEVPFVWTPNTAAGTTLTGDVQMRAFPIGGSVGEQVTQDFSWPCQSKPTWTDVLARESEAVAE